MKQIHIEKLLTFSGVIAVTIATSYMVRTYLDYLRIKKLKEEMNNGGK
jgi:hypothetical protein